MDDMKNSQKEESLTSSSKISNEAGKRTIIKKNSEINLAAPNKKGKKRKINYLIFILIFILFRNSKANIIKIKINLSKNQSIYSYIYNPTFQNKPDQILINGVDKKDDNSGYHYFNETNNNITLIWYNTWYNTFKNLSFLFDGCTDITEIDFSNFNSSNIISMNNLFRNCYSLTSLIIIS